MRTMDPWQAIGRCQSYIHMYLYIPASRSPFHARLSSRPFAVVLKIASFKQRRARHHHNSNRQPPVTPSPSPPSHYCYRVAARTLPARTPSIATSRYLQNLGAAATGSIHSYLTTRRSLHLPHHNTQTTSDLLTERCSTSCTIQSLV